MKKQEFLYQLKGKLWALSEEERKSSLEYYTEMIDDRMEDGLSEEEAVAAIGTLDEIVEQILDETPRPPEVVKPAQKQAGNRNGTKVWIIISLILGSPLWISLGAAAVAVLASVYASLWTVVISLYATTLALGASALGCILGSFFIIESVTKVTVAWGAALLCAGLTILLFMLSNLAAKGMIALTKLAWNGIRSVFQRKERTA